MPAEGERDEEERQESEDKKERGRKGGRIEGLGTEGGREFVLYFIIVFKEPHLFWREELSLTNIQTIFTI